MNRLRTLRVRFAVWVAGLLFVVLTVFGLFVYASLAQGLAASIDDALRLSASQVIALISIENGQLDLSDIVPGRSAAVDLRERGLTIRVLDPTGRLLQAFGPYGDLPVDAQSLRLVRQLQATFTTVDAPDGSSSVRFYTAPVTEAARLIGVVQIAQSLAGVRETLGRLATALLLSVPLLMLVAAVGGYFLAARALAPIDQITRTARRISAEDLSARLDLSPTDDEVGRLAATFDDMLARLDQSFRRERQFTADASHELRTPLAAMQAILSVVREARRTPEDYEQALADLGEETDRLRGLVEDLLHLARNGAARPPAYQTVDLSWLLRDVTESMRPLAEDKHLVLNCDVPDGLTVQGDRDELIRLVVNLLHNAVKYTERGRVDVHAALSASDRMLNVTVADTGIGIAPEHLPHVFDRFYRADPSRSARGTGLGLAIALSIARAHGGTIDARSVAGAGSTFVVKLPATP